MLVLCTEAVRLFFILGIQAVTLLLFYIGVLSLNLFATYHVYSTYVSRIIPCDIPNRVLKPSHYLKPHTCIICSFLIEMK